METDTIIHQSSGSEANKLYKINGIYYHFFSQVNNRGERRIMMERSDNLYGKWEIKQLNRVDIPKDREPNQGGLLQVDDDKWFFLTHHGHGDWEGRPASLLPVTWINGWPIIGKVAADTIGEMVWFHKKPIKSEKKLFIQSSDEFNSEKLGVQWEWNYQPRKEKWSLTERRGFLRLHAFRPINPDDGKKVILRAGNTITQRSMRTKKNVVTMKMNIQNMENGQFAGLTHLSTENSSLFGIKETNGTKNLVYVFNDKETVSVKIGQKNIWLQSQWDINGKNKYFYSLDGKKFIPFSDESQMIWGSYRGDRIGIFNYNLAGDNGYVDIDWFRYVY
jgi:beta-xylosidase